MLACVEPLQSGPDQGKPATGHRAGYHRHWKAGEPACDECLDAINQFNKARYVRRSKTVRECQRCGREFLGWANQKNCCKPSGHSRSVPDWVRAEVFERDGLVCQICFKPTNPDDYRRSRGRDGRRVFLAGVDYPTLDHIQPRSKGGSDDPDNLRVAHFSCNGARGNRDNEQLVLL